MVRFEKDRFIIEVKTGINPIENWLGTIQDLLSVLRAQDPDLANGEKHYFTFALLEEMLPEWEDAKKMAEV